MAEKLLDKFFILLDVQYGVFSPQVKNIILNILNITIQELKFSESGSSKLTYFCFHSKKMIVLEGQLFRECGPWSANHVSSTKIPIISVNENENFNKLSHSF